MTLHLEGEKAPCHSQAGLNAHVLFGAGISLGNILCAVSVDHLRSAARSPSYSFPGPLTAPLHSH